MISPNLSLRGPCQWTLGSKVVLPNWGALLEDPSIVLEDACREAHNLQKQ